MLWFRPLPWDYATRNLFRRPGRSALTLLGLGTVVFIVLLVVSFLRGLDASLEVSGDPTVVLVHTRGASENIENSTIPGNGASLLSASLGGIDSVYQQQCISPELYLGTEMTTESLQEPAMGLVRGVTLGAPLVRKRFQLLDGDWPQAGEVLVGKLAATKLGRSETDLSIGRKLTFEGRSWTISGRFVAHGAAFESELWCRVEDLQQAMKRQDLSLVALSVTSLDAVRDVQEFCQERVDLEWQATPESTYYASLQTHYGPVRMAAILIVFLVAGAGVFAGLNTMYGAVVGRVRELAMLQTVGFSRRAIALSILQEGLILSAAGSLLACGCALLLLNGTAVRFTMGAFSLQVDSLVLLSGLSVGFLTGLVGAIPPAWRALRMPIVDGLKAF
jgi:putative ABC transport system permease protein